MIDAQPEDLGCITGLDTVTLALPSITSDDGEVRTSDGQDGTAIVGIRVELPLLRVCEGSVRHCRKCGKGGEGKVGWARSRVQDGRRRVGRRAEGKSKWPRGREGDGYIAASAGAASDSAFPIGNGRGAWARVWASSKMV